MIGEAEIWEKKKEETSEREEESGREKGVLESELRPGSGRLAGRVQAGLERGPRINVQLGLMGSFHVGRFLVWIGLN